MNEDIIPLLKSIYDVLQTMRDDKLHLGPTEIHLDEPFNALPSPPPVPPSSPKYRKQLLRASRQDLHLFKEEPINIEDNLTVLEPPERDVEDYQQSSFTSQRLIPVDMDLLRTDEKLIWEPDSNSNEELKVEEEVKNQSAQFRQFPEETYFQLVEELKVRQSGSSLTRSSTLEADLCDKPPQLPQENSEIFARKPSDTQSSSEDTVLIPILKKSSHQRFESDQKDDKEWQQLKTQASQAVQVNLMTSHSAQFLTFDNQLEEQELSEEKHLKTSKEALFPTSVDIGTDCPDFDNIHRTSSNQEPSKPQDQEMTNFIESILLDLKAMESARNTSFSRLPCPSPVVWQKPSKDLSYPATIETVQELGANSLFVKWRVQNLGNIGGYELFLDGNLTNRYFNCIHRAAVICDVNLKCPHRITLRAQPLLPPRTTISLTKNNSSCLSSFNNKTSTTHPEASCPQLDGSVWYPSVYHFEPNSLSAPQNAVLY
ncbi:uncharacterized protein LOC129919903 [Episyrphus balteatus]|uniref:uncharacterized protein LOC129919903 n=1 Tax=Episyrphus balteatus TaxID=286459 RepID=UPI0024853C3B|nr:uncharacterized protein LOC129919903 [Episyrphus balteatus]